MAINPDIQNRHVLSEPVMPTTPYFKRAAIITTYTTILTLHGFPFLLIYI